MLRSWWSGRLWSGIKRQAYPCNLTAARDPCPATVPRGRALCQTLRAVWDLWRSGDAAKLTHTSTPKWYMRARPSPWLSDTSWETVLSTSVSTVLPYKIQIMPSEAMSWVTRPESVIHDHDKKQLNRRLSSDDKDVGIAKGFKITITNNNVRRKTKKWVRSWEISAEEFKLHKEK